MNDNAPLSDIERHIMHLRLACMALRNQLDTLVGASKHLERTSATAVAALRVIGAGQHEGATPR